MSIVCLLPRHGVLQAGQFGAAQNRERLIVLAAAPGEKLPQLSEPSHVTARDILSDIPCIPNGHTELEMSYGGEAKSHFQKVMRRDSPKLRDHVCKLLQPLTMARVERVPPGGDWRDLKNESVLLSDGRTRTDVLEYKYRDKEGEMKGVCPCVDGRSNCDPREGKCEGRNTLIPWGFAHRPKDNNNCYGRVAWDGFFQTILTDPQPSGRQGRVLHPDQHR